MHNKKLIIYGSIGAGTLIIVIFLLFIFLFRTGNKQESVTIDNGQQIFKAVPSDAIMICDIGNNTEVLNTLTDTSAFGSFLINSNNAMMKIEEKLKNNEDFRKAHTIYSLHYSSKNKVSFLQITDLSSINKNGESFSAPLKQSSCSSRAYNNTVIYNLNDSLCFSLYRNCLLLSNSRYILESSIRHLIKGVSILDNQEFSAISSKNISTDNSILYLRHSYSGKIFSGIIGRKLWKYADFFSKLSLWSIYNIESSNNGLTLNGRFYNGSDDSKQTRMFCKLEPQKTKAQEIIPANALIAITIPFENREKYINCYGKFLGANKKLLKYESNLHNVTKKGSLDPLKWADSLGIDEVTAMYIPIQGKYEWVNAFRCKSGSGLKGIIPGLFKKGNAKICKFSNKGYLSALFGELFNNANEDYYVITDSWTIIGSKGAITQFAAIEQPYLNIDEYLNTANEKRLIKANCISRVFVNMQSGKDTICTKIIGALNESCFQNGFNKRNFLYLTVDINVEDNQPQVLINIVGKNISNLNIKRKLKNPVAIDTKEHPVTIEKSSGPFELKEFDTGEKCFMQQMPNNALQYYNKEMKAVWAIPFNSPLCGKIEQVDLFKNDKLQMIFVSEDKLYALDRRGRFVNNYPRKLCKMVEFGPILIDRSNNKNYEIIVLNKDNSISLYDLEGNKPQGWQDIKTPEPIYKMPEVLKVNGRFYLIVKTPDILHIYSFLGKEIVPKRKNRIFVADNHIKSSGGDVIRIKCIDGKYYMFNLVTLDIKKER